MSVVGRREFLKGALLTAGSASAVGSEPRVGAQSAPPDLRPSVPISWCSGCCLRVASWVSIVAAPLSSRASHVANRSSSSLDALLAATALSAKTRRNSDITTAR